MVSSLKFFLFTIIFILHLKPLSAQQNKYFIYFKDKNNSSYSISNPSQFLSLRCVVRRDKFTIPITIQDLPVNKNYIDSVAAKGASILYSLKWFNGVMINATPGQLAAIHNLPFVVSSTKTLKLGSSTLKTGTQSNQDLNWVTKLESLTQVSQINYGPSFAQFQMMDVDQMHLDGYTGKGKLIAVLDDGFLNINTLPAFDSLFAFNRVKATYDFVGNDADVFTKGHGHGTNVLSILASYVSGSLIGGAWQADYLLFKTEDDNSESISEEYNWVKAAEVADSAGADLISSSVGYNQFDDPSMNHSYADFNGDITVVATGADIAASKGILIMTAAGNEGNNSWKHILTPADADSVITVGGVNPDGSHSITSSIGPASDGRIKPDLVAQGTHVYLLNPDGSYINGSGTSFSTPLVTGLAAGISQAFPNLSNMELMYYLKRSASRFAHPDNTYGYGIPSYLRFRELMSSEDFNQIHIYPNPIQTESLVITIPKEEIGHEGQVSIYNSEGKLMGEDLFSTLTISNTLKLDLQSWSKGVYFLTLRTDYRMYKLKFLKF